jgi:hypothetical protein
MVCYDAVTFRKKEDLPKIKADLDALIASYDGKLVMASDKEDMDIFETPEGVIIRKLYKDNSFFRFLSYGIPVNLFLMGLDEIKEKYK